MHQGIVMDYIRSEQFQRDTTQHLKAMVADGGLKPRTPMEEEHAFEPYNENWAKPRCKLCQKFEEEPIHLEYALREIFWRGEELED